MDCVTLSPKYQVVIPKHIRKQCKLKPGEKLIMFLYEGRIELIPEKNIKELQGALKGINTEISREQEDRL